MPTAIRSAASAPATRAITDSVISIPAVTPDEVTKRPSSTHRACRTQRTAGPCSTTQPKDFLFDVALRPSSKRARARSAAPVQTEVTVSASSSQPFERYVVLHLFSSPDPTRHQDHVELRTFGKRVVRDGLRPLGFDTNA
jgi:hypothetical protein